jgi:hypothetical protein
LLQNAKCANLSHRPDQGFGAPRCSRVGGDCRIASGNECRDCKRGCTSSGTHFSSRTFASFGRVAHHGQLPTLFPIRCARALYLSPVSAERRCQSLNAAQDFLRAIDPNHYRGNPPASKFAIENLTESTLADCAEDGCSVCQDEMEKGAVVLRMPCGHRFHRLCLVPWLAEKNTCPVCRCEIESHCARYNQANYTKLKGSLCSETESNYENGDALPPTPSQRFSEGESTHFAAPRSLRMTLQMPPSGLHSFHLPPQTETANPRGRGISGALPALAVSRADHQTVVGSRNGVMARLLATPRLSSSRRRTARGMPHPRALSSSQGSVAREAANGASSVRGRPAKRQRCNGAASVQSGGGVTERCARLAGATSTIPAGVRLPSQEGSNEVTEWPSARSAAQMGEDLPISSRTRGSTSSGSLPSSASRC